MNLIKVAPLALCTVGVVGLATPVFAAKPGNSTIQTHHGTQTIPTKNPCTGAPGTVTLSFHDVTHMSFNSNGGGTTTETSNGTFSFVPTDTTQPSYTGHYVMWDGGPFRGTVATLTATASINGQGSDGSHLVFHEVQRFTVDFSTTPPTVTITFDKPTCN